MSRSSHEEIDVAWSISQLGELKAEKAKYCSTGWQRWLGGPLFQLLALLAGLPPRTTRKKPIDPQKR